MMIKGLVGYETNYSVGSKIQSFLDFLAGGKHRFLQDSAHIFKFCTYSPNSTNNSAIAESQNPGGTEYHIKYTHHV